MGLFIAVVIGLGLPLAAYATIRARTIRQFNDLRDRHQLAATALTEAIDQRRLVAENLGDTLTNLSIRKVDLLRIEEAEGRVKDSIRRHDAIEEIVTCGCELNEAVSAVIAIATEQAYGSDPLVAACFRGWDQSRDAIEHATLAYNDTVMTWSEFLQSRRARWLGRFAEPTPLRCVDWDCHSSDSDRADTDVNVSA